MAPRALPGMLGAVVSRPVRHRPGGAPGPARPGPARPFLSGSVLEAARPLTCPGGSLSSLLIGSGTQALLFLIGGKTTEPRGGRPGLGCHGREGRWSAWRGGIRPCLRPASPQGRQPLVQGFTTSLSQKNRTALSGGKSAKDGLKQKLVTPLQTRLICSVNNSETPWLPRFTCPRLVREHDQQSPWQRFSSAPAKSGAENTFECSRRFGKENNTKDLLPQRDFCRAKGYVALETYDPSEYDPFFLKTHTDCWKVSIPPLQDPLLKDIQRKLIETGIIKQCETGRPCSTRELNKLSRAELPQLPLGRQGMDAAQWLKVPHAYIASEVHQRKRQELMWCLLRGSTTATVDEASPWLHSRVFAKT
ncbi:protein FAM228B isoform X2 [Falco peregrinus]|uniref:protein FAM228B isoform X2 n=1 Tax=Falco peregrinus TaxID=8954 RepID=UPI00247B1EB2|nr:protein FAM228B isoform X2 [Falco peregrinus]